jgi:probable phosphoglycerate mutase
LTAGAVPGWPATCCGWLLRHGESDGNVRGLVQGQLPEIGLSARGEEQVRAAAAGLTAHGAPAVALVVSSDLRRCQETAQLLAAAAGAPTVLEPGLRERSFGRLEGTAWADVDPALVGLRDGRVVDADARPPRGESLTDLARRVALVLTGPLAYAPGPVLIVTHGGPIRIISAGRAGHPLLGLAWGEVPYAAPLPLCLRPGEHGRLGAGEHAGGTVGGERVPA